jgi:hypothetical protein
MTEDRPILLPALAPIGRDVPLRKSGRQRSRPSTRLVCDINRQLSNSTVPIRPDIPMPRSILNVYPASISHR